MSQVDMLWHIAEDLAQMRLTCEQVGQIQVLETGI
jgi:hypothetical protein